MSGSDIYVRLDGRAVYVGELVRVRGGVLRVLFLSLSFRFYWMWF